MTDPLATPAHLWARRPAARFSTRMGTVHRSGKARGETPRPQLGPSDPLMTFVVLFFLIFTAVAQGQQRPLLTEDPRLIPPGAVDVEAGITYENDAVYSLSGLRGNHVALLPTALNFGLGDRAEFQIGGVVRDFLKAGDVWH